MMIFSIKLWIIFCLCCLDFCQNQDFSSGVIDLANKLELAFSNLKNILKAAQLSEKTFAKNPLTEEKIINILTKSKEETEKIIKKANVAVNTIQSQITENYKEYATTNVAQYLPDCGNVSYVFYYRAKSLKNDSIADVTNCTSQTLPLQKDPFLNNILTNRQMSTAHVPTNVYDASKEIQAVASWSENVDKVFLKRRYDSQLKWQFFCSSTGLFKIYPGIRWNIQTEDSEKESTLVDFFDCRSEQWYLEATAYPKKMMIMVDKSGSMKGRRRIIANHTIYEILNTLTENDYFNILLFTKEHFFADNTTSGILMQATDKNKKYIIDQLGIVFIPDGIAEYDVGLNASFNVLRNDKFNESDSNLYNYLLMIITDGSPMAYQELIDYNNKDVGARIFTYLIGQGATERDMVTSMACKNRGYAVEIATLADVKENVQKYLNVIARTNALMKNSFNVWTGVHQMQMQPTEALAPVNNTIATIQPINNPNTFSITFATNATVTPPPEITISTQGNITMPMKPVQTTKIEIYKDQPINLFVTASKATFDETNATAQMNNGILLGAAGVDVPISEFIKTTPFWKIGVNAYLFGITSNGFVLFHPRFRPQYRKFIKYFYRNVDISELEVDSNFSIAYIRNDQIVESNYSFQLRSAMLNQYPNSPIKLAGKLNTYQIIDDYKTAFTVLRNYFIFGIDKTSYKFGLAVPVNQQVPLYTSEYFEKISMETFKEDFNMDYESFKNQCGIININKNGSGITMKNHEFCKMNNYIATLQMEGPLCALIDVFTNDTTLKNCIGNKSDESLYLNNLHSEIKMTSTFPNTWANINTYNQTVQQIFSMHHFGLIRYYNYDTLSYEHFITNHSLGIEDPLYQETILTAQHLKNNEICVARPLPSDVVQKNIDPNYLVFTVTTPLMYNGEYVGIVGVQAKHNMFLSILMESPLCSTKKKAECYVVTQSGLILMNNQNFRNNGDQLKDVNCALMESLVESNIFERQQLYDFQGLCVNLSRNIESFANRLINPFTQLFRFTLWMIYEIFMLLQNISLTNIYWLLTAQEDSNEPVSSSIGDKNLDFSLYSTDSSAYKSIGNLIPPVAKKPRFEMKSKQSHEDEVKKKFTEEIKTCNSNNYESENGWSECIQKGVSTVCRLDKNSASEQHLDKVTSGYSHCVTVCAIVHSEYPKVWQDQDECKQPLKLCRTVSQSFISSFSSSSQSAKPFSHVTYLKYREDIIQDVPYPNDIKEKDESSLPTPIKYGSVCNTSCAPNKWFVSPIKNTNLLLIVLDKQNECNCDCSSSFGKKIELSRKINESIENPFIMKQYYFQEFVNFTKKENSTTCTDNSRLSSIPQEYLIILSILLSVLIAS